MTAARAGTVAAAEAKEPVLEFAAAKSLSYRRRMGWSLGLLAAGFALQVAFLSFLPGLPFLVAALVLSWVRGFDDRLDRRRYEPSEAWETVPFEKIEAIVQVERRLRRWDESAFDLSSGAGAALWLCLGLGVVGGAFALDAIAGRDVALVAGLDGAILLLAQWFSGMRTIDRKPDLVLKARHLAGVGARMGERIASLGTLAGQLRLSQGGGREPVDARFVVRREGGPKPFLGLQAQVVLNRVQGRPFPYFYAVAVAKKGAGLAGAARRAKPPAGVVIEADAEAEGDVEVAVVRQETTRTSGYHTDAAASDRVLGAALDLVEGWLPR